jgi:hypothetical protein
LKPIAEHISTRFNEVSLPVCLLMTVIVAWSNGCNVFQKLHRTYNCDDVLYWPIMNKPCPRRVAITGLGAITPLGNDIASTWDAVKAAHLSGLNAPIDY